MTNGTRKWRQTQAIHLHFTTNMTNREIAEKLDVHETTISGYLNDDYAEEVNEMVETHKSQVMMESLRVLKEQLRDLHDQMREVEVEREEAEVEVKIYRNDEGEVQYDTFTDDNGQEQMYKVPQGYEVEPDGQTRYFRRSEWREISRDIRDVLQEMRSLLGVEQADRIRIEHSGGVDHRHGLDEQTRDLIDGMDFEA